MNKFRNMITALTLSAALLFTGCGVRPYQSSLPDSGSSLQAAESIPQTEPPEYQSDISANTRSVGNDQSVTPMSINVSERGFTATNALFCSEDDSKQILITGEYENIYIFILIFVKEMTAHSSFTQEDFGDIGTDKYIAVTLMDPANNGIHGGVTPPYLTDIALSVGDITDDYMDISLSGTLIGLYTFDISGSTSISTIDECLSVVSEYDAIAANIKSSLENENTEPIRCTGCNGTLKCRFCDGDGTCSACLWLIDHCISCGGSDVCQYCGGTGICHYCNGEGVTY